MLIHTWWEKWDEAKVAKTDRRRFTSSGLDVIWQSSILVNKWRGQGTETGKRSKTLINYLYLLNETTLILVSRSGTKRADLSSAFNVVGISQIRAAQKAHCALESFITAAVRTLYSRPGGKTGADGQRPWKLQMSQQAWRKSRYRNVHIRSKPYRD